MANSRTTSITEKKEKKRASKVRCDQFPHPRYYPCWFYEIWEQEKSLFVLFSYPFCLNGSLFIPSSPLLNKKSPLSVIHTIPMVSLCSWIRTKSQVCLGAQFLIVVSSFKNRSHSSWYHSIQHRLDKKICWTRSSERLGWQISFEDESHPTNISSTWKEPVICLGRISRASSLKIHS